MQGDILSMVSYGIGVLPLIKFLKTAYPDVTHTWYADNDGTLGTFENIGLYFNSLKHFGLGRGYYPEPTKTVLILHLDKPAAGKEFGLHNGFRVFTSALYLGGFIGYDESKCEWIK